MEYLEINLTKEVKDHTLLKETEDDFLKNGKICLVLGLEELIL